MFIEGGVVEIQHVEARVVAGPPPVMTYACVKTWNEPITAMMLLKRMMGLSMGSVMLRKRWKMDEPSIAAGFEQFARNAP